MTSRNIKGLLAMSVFVAALYLMVIMQAVSVYRLLFISYYDPLGWTLTALLVAAAWLPLSLADGPGPRSFINLACSAAGKYFPITVKVEDEQSLERGRAYVIGYEPHSALPIGIPAVFATYSPLLPPVLRGATHGLASSVCFKAPFVRHLWWMLGLRPADKPVLDELLSSGKSVVLCPGGVQECLYMSHEDELVFLTSRRGFIKAAMQHGAPLVPVFAFGQSKSYNWVRPGPPIFPRWLIHKVSRFLGAVPLVMYGAWGTPVPFRYPVAIVIGKPIEVPKNANPSPELVQKYLDCFISELASLHERYKAECGYPSSKLRVM